MKLPRVVLMDFLHLFVLVSFAVAQPLYDLLGQNPEFFVAHNARPAQIIGMIFLLSIGVALGLVLLELAAWLVGERLRLSMHGIFVCGLAILIVMPPAKRLVGGTDLLIAGGAILMGFIFALIYMRWQAVRLFLTVLAPVVVAFPLWFLLLTPVGRLVMPDAIGALAEIEIKNPVPVVLVVLDEFNITALLDAEGRIDPMRFPNFAALAAESWWFPNAVATSGSTERAVPAILTGRQPQPDVPLSPTATDYPQNLFTLLGDHYRLNVMESVATLCPDSLCGQKGDPIELRGYVHFFSDLAVIYLHIIAPPKLSQRLPSLDAQWTGFGGKLIKQITFNEHKVSSLRKNYNKDSHNKKYLFLDNFLSQIKENDQPVLHFLHVLLPHVPYEYLASGLQYLPEEGRPFPAGIINEKEGWVGAEPLILTAYHRYLQQVGYVDRFLGKLRKKLETAQLYNNALIILTADHGVSFQTGLSRRGIVKGNASDMLKIPLIVKLPGQEQGRIDERMVSSVDILSTIADVLNVKVPWDMDGYSMFTNQEMHRTEIAIPGIGHFKLKDLKGFPRLKWQVDHFGEHTSFDGLVPLRPYPSLIGQNLSDLRIEKPSALRFINSDLNQFKYVNRESNFLPALFRAHIVGTEERNLPIAVALNGRIWATTITSAWKSHPNYFTVLFPPAAFKNGRNVEQVFLIKETKEEYILAPLMLDGRQHARLDRDQAGRLSLFFSDGREIPVEEGMGIMRGGMGQVSSIGNMLVVEGWAADIEAPKPAEAALIFSGNNLVLQTELATPRPDVVAAQKQEGLLHSGFRAVVPLESLQTDVNEIKVILVSKEGRALHFPFSDEQKTVIRAALE